MQDRPKADVPSRRTTSSLVQTPNLKFTTAAVGASHAPWNRPLATRPFSHTATCQAKRKAGKNGKNNNANTDVDATAEDAETASQTPEDAPPTKSRSKSKSKSKSATAAEDEEALNPSDFSELQTAFERTETRYLEDLKKLRSGGRFNADAIGTIPVQPDKKSPQTYALRELATVAPLGGRRWSILAFEEASVKPIISAVQRSDEFNQQPQRSESNPLELTMTVEPERADALAKRAKDICQVWRVKVREEAHKRGELHKKWRGEGLVLSDEAHKLKEKLQKLQDDRMKGILAKEKEVVGAIMARAG
jgi:ribosome recycling factor